MPPVRLHGARHAVIVWKRSVSGLSALTNVSERPWRTVGGSPARPGSERSPWV